MVNSLIRGAVPIYSDAYAGTIGISEPRFDAPLEWARSVQVDIDAARRYAQAVYANTDEYLSEPPPRQWT